MSYFIGGAIAVQNNWKECKLGDVVESANTGLDAIKRAPIVDIDTGIKCLRIQDVSQKKEFINWGFTQVNDKDYSKFKLKQNDILIARTGASIGVKTFISEDMDAVFNNGLIRIGANSSIYPKYLFYNFLSTEYNGFIESISGGTSTQPNMQIGALLSFDLSLPPLEEQKAIAEVLSSLDDKIDLLHRQNQTLESLAQTLFRQWFIEEAKEEWEEVLITDLFEVRDGTHDSPKQKEFGKKLLTSKHILKNKLDFESSYFISEEDFEKINQRSLVEQGDILFSMIGTIGLTYLEQSNEIDYAIKNIGLFKTSQNKKFMYFVYLWLNSSFGVEFIHENRSGSTQEYISLGSLRNIIFNLPNYKIIDLFNEKMEPIFEKINTNMKQIKSLENLRDTLLPKLLSGEVRVKI